MGASKATESKEIQILAVESGRVSVAIVGTSPLICNTMSEKAKHSLVLGGGRKTAAEKAQNVKHDVLAEYRSSPYKLTADDSPTLLAVLAVSFKKAMMTAALDIPGAKKAQVGRLVRVEGERVPLYGIPKLFMAVTRSADINRTPDVRTRVILPQWATLLNVTFAKPALREKAVLNLLAAAGMFSGVGDWRTEKGSGNYGSFRLASADDPELNEILSTGGRSAQLNAMNSPSFYDDDSEDLFNWYSAEVQERGFAVAR